MEMVKVKINGNEISVPKGMNLIEAAKQAGADIPHFCYHSHLSVAGNCRMCTVEIENQRGLPIACNTQCAEGMVVNTETEKVKETRAAVMEFLLINHPIDCPVCDQAGECRLQQYYIAHDRRDSAVPLDDKVEKGKAIEVGPRVMLDQERCVACSRCVRFCDEITKTGELRLMNRGDHTTIDCFPGKTLDNHYSVNTADICPVGALTPRDFRFQARVWWLRDTQTICPGCATGCNVNLSVYDQVTLADYNGKAFRLKPRVNDDVNKAWMCDFGRTEYRRVNDRRIKQPIAHSVEVSWEGALGNLRTVLAKALSGQHGGVAGVASFDCTNEEIQVFKRLLREAFGQEEIALLPKRPIGVRDEFLIDEDKHANTRGTKLVAGSAAVKDVAAYLRGKSAVIVLDANPLAPFLPEGVRQAFAAIKCRIALAANESETTEGAAVILPVKSFAEKDGTWVNRDGRVQRIRKATRGRTDSQDDLEVMRQLAAVRETHWTSFDAMSVFNEISILVPEFAGLDYDKIDRLGAPLVGAKIQGVGAR